MGKTVDAVKALVAASNVRISEHGYDELAEDRIAVRDVVAGVSEAVVIEDYPEYPKGPAVLVLQYDHENEPVHVVWGIPKGHSGPAVLVTAYRPDLRRWLEGFLERRK